MIKHNGKINIITMLLMDRSISAIANKIGQSWKHFNCRLRMTRMLHVVVTIECNFIDLIRSKGSRDSMNDIDLLRIFITPLFYLQSSFGLNLEKRENS